MTFSAVFAALLTATFQSLLLENEPLLCVEAEPRPRTRMVLDEMPDFED
jgi:hypothetical protein